MATQGPARPDSISGRSSSVSSPEDVKMAKKRKSKTKSPWSMGMLAAHTDEVPGSTHFRHSYTHR